MGRYHRLLDGSPRNIDRGIVVRTQAETALLTAKGGLGLTIGFFTMSTLRAGATGVPWVNELERNARPSCLVGNASSQVEKSPAMPFIAVFPTNRDSLSNAGEVFKSECLASVNGFLNQGLTDTLISVFLETLLTSTHPFEAAFGRAGPHLLQALATAVIAQTDFMDFGPAEGLPCAIGGQVHHAKINSEGLLRLPLLRGFSALGHMQIVETTPPDEISPTDGPCRIDEQGVLTLAQDHAADHAPVQRIEGNTVKTHQAVGPCIIAHTAPRAKLRTRLLLLGSDGFDRFHRLGPRTTRQLSTKAKAGAGFAIDAVMGGSGVGNPLLPTKRGNPRSRFIKTLLRLLQNGFMACYVKLNTDGSRKGFAHKKSVADSGTTVKKAVACGRRRFLPRLDDL